MARKKRNDEKKDVHRRLRVKELDEEQPTADSEKLYTDGGVFY